MPDEVADPVQQKPSEQPPVTPPTPATEDWERRYKGSVAKIEQLTLQNRELSTQLAGKTSESEQLSTQLSTKDVEKDIAVGERQKQLNELIAAKAEADRELADLRALQLKIEVINELKAPELVSIMNTIPAVTDKEALTTVMKDIMNFGQNMVRARETQLLSGVTPPASQSGPTSTAPSTHESWNEHINSLALGTPERKKAMDDYFAWGMAQERQS